MSEEVKENVEVFIYIPIWLDFNNGYPDWKKAKQRFTFQYG